MKQVTEEQFRKFIKDYPRKLEHNFFMDSHSWHDFTLGPEGKSFVAMADISYTNDKLENFRITEEEKEKK
jgi:hypothetical protein